MTRESSWIVLDPLEFDLQAGEFPHESNCRCDFCELAMTYNPIADADYDLEHYGLHGRVFDDNENIAYFARVNAGPCMTRDYYERYCHHLRWLRKIKRDASVSTRVELQPVCEKLGWCNENIVAKIYRHAYSQAYW